MRRLSAALFACAFVFLLGSIPAQADAGDRSPDPIVRVHKGKRIAYARARDTAQPDFSLTAFSKPIRHTARRLSCAINVNLALAEKGIRGTGSALAKSFLRWGRPSAPVPGAVAVYHRGGKRSISGHVAIVSRVEGGRVYVFNPSRSGWREVVYPKRAIAYRVAG